MKKVLGCWLFYGDAVAKRGAPHNPKNRRACTVLKLFIDSSRRTANSPDDESAAHGATGAGHSYNGATGQNALLLFFGLQV